MRFSDSRKNTEKISYGMNNVSVKVSGETVKEVAHKASEIFGFNISEVCPVINNEYVNWDYIIPVGAIIRFWPCEAKKFLVVVERDYVDARMKNIAPDFDKMGISNKWYDVQGELVVGNYYAKTKEKAIEDAAIDQLLNTEILDAYELI